MFADDAPALSNVNKSSMLAPSIFQYLMQVELLNLTHIDFDLSKFIKNIYFKSISHFPLQNPLFPILLLTDFSLTLFTKTKTYSAWRV